jgi:hypothetical protein
MAHVLLPLPARDFDPSEAAVSWQVIVNAGNSVSSATPDGLPAVADDIVLTGRGLDLWGAIPLLRNSAWSLACVVRFWDPNYYRTYLERAGQPKGFMSVQQEVARALAGAEDFRDVPKSDPDYPLQDIRTAARFLRQCGAGLCRP